VVGVRSSEVVFAGDVVREEGRSKLPGGGCIARCAGVGWKRR